jgi:hypothetical protein
MRSPATDIGPLRYATSDLPERERYPVWRELFSRKVVLCDIEAKSDLPFQAEATLLGRPEHNCSNSPCDGRACSALRSSRPRRLANSHIVVLAGGTSVNGPVGRRSGADCRRFGTFEAGRQAQRENIPWQDVLFEKIPQSAPHRF